MTDTTKSPMRDANARIDLRTRELVGRLQNHRSLVRLVIILAIAFTLFAVLKPGTFLSPTNLQNIMISAPEIGVISIAMALAMLTGGIDLSLVAIANLTAITVSTTFTAIAANDPATAEAMGPVIILLGLVVGLAAGAINGFLIAVIGIAPILATLATMQIFNGLAVVWTGGKTLYGAPAFWSAVGEATVAGIPMLFIILIVVAIVVGVVVSRTPLGRKVQFLGSNELAAKYAGISSTSVLMRTYMLSGLLGAVAGLLFIARNPTASADYGLSYVLLAIVIAVLGGTNPFGGYATIAGVVLATLVLQVVSSGFTAVRLSSYEYSIAQGVILIAVMIIDQMRGRYRRKRKVGTSDPSVSETVTIATSNATRRDAGLQAGEDNS